MKRALKVALLVAVAALGIWQAPVFTFDHRPAGRPDVNNHGVDWCDGTYQPDGSGGWWCKR